MVQKKLKHKKDKYNIFIKNFLKKGKIQKLKKIINSTFLKISKETNISFTNIFLKTIFHFYTYIEIKSVKKKKRLNIIPFSIKQDRRFFLVLKEIHLLLKKKHRSISFNLHGEILKIVMGSSKIKDSKRSNISQAFAYRSNTHYRWSL